MTTTQNCAECGTRAEPGQSFCDACGAVLDWTDRARATAATPASSAEAAVASGAQARGSGADTRPDTRPDGRPSASDTDSRTDSGGNGTPDRGSRDVPPVPTQESAPTTPDATPTEPLPATAPEPEPEPEPDPTPAPSAPDDGLADRARQLLVPVADPEAPPAASPSVAPVLPGRPALQRPQAVRAPGEELGTDGGTPCPWCSTLNRPDRHYCARCAMPMAGERPVAGRLPWWRRLPGLGHRETPWAGERPRLRRAFDRVLTWLGAALVLALLILLAVNIPKGVQATRDHFAKRAPVAPDTYSASRSYPGHKPQLAFDKHSNTWWGPGVADSGQGQWIEAHFSEPTRLLDLIITPGVSTREDQISQSALPHRVEARITTADGKSTTRELTLDQGAGSQRIPFRVGKVTRVRFTLESAYQASTSKQVAIAEIEFFGPSNTNGT
ncbi:zinc ribbon domain-containing protein [Streptomyces sp. NPDC005728]|uniref:NADase-type glycan-binding domain-containing protein n=1 Tax=Streptomyces sp. NPDC005728 TaxID=3157054 RepID=UPI0033E320AF